MSVAAQTDRVAAHVCRYYGVTIDQLLGTSRAQEFSQPRVVLTYL